MKTPEIIYVARSPRNGERKVFNESTLNSDEPGHDEKMYIDYESYEKLQDYTRKLLYQLNIFSFCFRTDYDTPVGRENMKKCFLETNEVLSDFYKNFPEEE